MATPPDDERALVEVPRALTNVRKRSWRLRLKTIVEIGAPTAIVSFAVMDSSPWSLLWLIMSVPTVIEAFARPSRRKVAAAAADAGLSSIDRRNFHGEVEGHSVWMTRTAGGWRLGVQHHAPIAEILARPLEPGEVVELRGRPDIGRPVHEELRALLGWLPAISENYLMYDVLGVYQDPSIRRVVDHVIHDAQLLEADVDGLIREMKERFEFFAEAHAAPDQVSIGLKWAHLTHFVRRTALHGRAAEALTAIAEVTLEPHPALERGFVPPYEIILDALDDDFALVEQLCFDTALPELLKTQALERIAPHLDSEQHRRLFVRSVDLINAPDRIRDGFTNCETAGLFDARLVRHLLEARSAEDGRATLERWLLAKFDSLEGRSLDAATRVLGDLGSTNCARRLQAMSKKGSPAHQAAAQIAAAQIEARRTGGRGGVSLADADGGELGLAEDSGGRLGSDGGR